MTMESGVNLRPWKIENAPDLAAAINNKKVLDNLRDSIPYPYTEKDVAEFITATLAVEKETQYAFAVTVDGKVIGSVGVFRKENVHRLTAELGYYIAEPHWGKGFMTVAVRQMCAYVFDNTDIIRIFAEPYAFNGASCRVLEKAGFQFEGLLRKNAIKNGQSVDMKMYAILKSPIIQSSEIDICLITENKKDFLPLLLLGDEQESQIDKYLERGELFALYDRDVKSVCVVTDEGDSTLGIQNLATDESSQRQGYASRLIEYIANHYAGRYDKIILGTGDVPEILGFYERRGFAVTHRIPDYFTTHYDHPMIEDGVLLKDKVYLERKLV